MTLNLNSSSTNKVHNLRHRTTGENPNSSVLAALIPGRAAPPQNTPFLSRRKRKLCEVRQLLHLSGQLRPAPRRTSNLEKQGPQHPGHTDGHRPCPPPQSQAHHQLTLRGTPAAGAGTRQGCCLRHASTHVGGQVGTASEGQKRREGTITNGGSAET